MPRESPHYRDIYSNLVDKFGGKYHITVKEYAKYLGIGADTAAKLIKRGDLPGKAAGSQDKPIYIIPVSSIALYETKAANH